MLRMMEQKLAATHVHALADRKRGSTLRGGRGRSRRSTALSATGRDVIGVTAPRSASGASFEHGRIRCSLQPGARQEERV